MAIKLGIYEKGDSFGIYIRKLSEDHLIPFRTRLGLTEDINSIRCTSERLKLSKSVKAANDWIDRFYGLPIEEQLSRIGMKYVRKTTNEPLIVVNLQYYRLFIKGKLIKSSPFYNDLQSLGSIYGDFTITPSVHRQVSMTKTYHETIKDKIIDHPKQASDIQGMMLPVAQIKRRKLVGKDGSVADRHSGFRTTSTPSFYKNR